MLIPGAIDLITAEVFAGGRDLGGAVYGIDGDDDEGLDLRVAGADEG